MTTKLTMKSLAERIEQLEGKANDAYTVIAHHSNEIAAMRDFTIDKLIELESRIDELESDVNGLDIDAEHYQAMLLGLLKKQEQHDAEIKIQAAKPVIEQIKANLNIQKKAAATDGVIKWIRMPGEKSIIQKDFIPVSLEFDTTGFSKEQCDHLIELHQHYSRRPGQVDLF